jgi:glycosyltransferase involved in cell wall biosynthesis
VLPLGALMKFIYKSKLIYDAHEIETETQEVVGFRKIFSKAVERIMMNFVDITILTSQGHADWYARNYKGSNIEVVENFPYIKSHQEENQNIFRKKFNISEDDLVFIYQGYLSEARGVKLILDSFKEIDVSKHIVFMGFGDLKGEIEKTATEYPNIHIHESVVPDQVYNYTRCADVGIHMMDDSCINHLYALPNKPMEYMNAGLPAIVSDLPIMGALVRDARSGWLVKPNDQEAFKGIISSINREDIAFKSQNSLAWTKENNWEKQEEKLSLIYKQLN